MFYLRVFQHFTRGQTVTSAQNQYFFDLRQLLHHRQDQGFVVARFIGGRKLQIAIDEQARVVVPFGHHQALVRRGAGVDDGIAKIILFGFVSDVVGIPKTGEQGQHYQATAPAQAVVFW